jgi:hypothetical protein
MGNILNDSPNQEDLRVFLQVSPTLKGIVSLTEVAAPKDFAWVT